jgi:hypothetical protein
VIRPIDVKMVAIWGLELVMRAAVSCLTFALGLNTIAIANAAYIIKLKNGNEYVTNRYWQDGSQVMFDAEGGIFGIEKGFVSKIEKADRVIRLATVAAQDPSERVQPENVKLQETDKAPTELKSVKERDPADPVVGEFNRLKSRSAEVDGMLASEIRQLLDEITAFKNKISKDSKLFIEYGREMNDLHELGDVVETALRARTN